jgi:PAS domain S-box-containing protein
MELLINHQEAGLEQVNLLLQEQKELLEMIATGVPLDDCLSALCRAVSRLSPGTRACVVLPDEEGESVPHGFLSDKPTSADEGSGGGPFGDPAKNSDLFFRGERIDGGAVARVGKGSPFWREPCLSQGGVACVSEPIIDLEGETLGCLLLGFDEARDPAEWEQRILKFGVYVARIAIARDRTSRAQRHSEERYVTLFQSINAGFSVLEVIEREGDPGSFDFRVLEVNQMLETVTGLKSVVGKTLRELIPESGDQLFQMIVGVASSGESAREEMQIGDRWFRFYSYRVDKPADRRVALLFEEITHRKRREKSLKYLANLSLELASEGGVDDLMQAAAASIGDFLSLSACAFVEVAEEANRLAVVYDWRRDEASGLVGVYPLTEYVPEELRQISRRGEVFQARGIAGKAQILHAGVTGQEACAFLCAPVVRDGRWRFGLCVYRPEHQPWEQDEIDLAERLARRIWTRLERARHEEALYESERKFRQIFEGAKDYAIFLMDTTGHITSWSPGAERLFGYAEDEVIHRDMELIFTPPDRAAQIPRRELERAKLMGVAENERWHQRKDGSRFYASGLTQPIIDFSGQHVGFTTICRDRTAHHQAREWLERELMDSQRLQEASARLVAEADLSALLDESLNAAISITHAQMGTIHLAEGEDATALRLLSYIGFQPGALTDFKQLRPQDETPCFVAIQAGKRVVIADFEKNHSLDNPAHAELLRAGVRAGQWTPLFSRPGRLLGVIATFWDHPHQASGRELRLLDLLARQMGDLVERQQAEARLRDLSQSLERMVEQRTAELREQTTRLQNLAAELASAEQRERKRLAALLHDDLQQLLVAASMQLRLLVGHTDELGSHAVAQASRWVEEARVAARDLTRQLRPPALYEDGLVAALHWLASEMENRHHLEVSIDGSEPAQPMSDDIKALLFECVRELLFNVTKYAGVTAAEVKLREQSDGLHISVADAGVGFDVDAVGTSRQSGGSGLFSIRERLFALGGEMKMASSPGHGTTIELHAPMADHSTDEEVRRRQGKQAPAHDGDKDAPPVSAGNRAIKVLVVDDHPMVREGIANIISSDQRMQVSGQACDGLEAIDMVEQHPPEVILMDLNMPRMNGIDATREIHRRWPEIRIIGLSVQDDSTTAKSICDAGAAAFVSKSAASDKMIAAILAEESCAC